MNLYVDLDKFQSLLQILKNRTGAGPGEAFLNLLDSTIKTDFDLNLFLTGMENNELLIHCMADFYSRPINIIQLNEQLNGWPFPKAFPYSILDINNQYYTELDQRNINNTICNNKNNSVDFFKTFYYKLSKNKYVNQDHVIFENNWTGWDELLRHHIKQPSDFIILSDRYIFETRAKHIEDSKVKLDNAILNIGNILKSTLHHNSSVCNHKDNRALIFTMQPKQIKNKTDFELENKIQLFYQGLKKSLLDEGVNCNITIVTCNENDFDTKPNKRAPIVLHPRLLIGNTFFIDSENGFICFDNNGWIKSKSKYCNFYSMVAHNYSDSGQKHLLTFETFFTKTQLDNANGVTIGGDKFIWDI